MSEWIKESISQRTAWTQHWRLLQCWLDIKKALWKKYISIVHTNNIVKIQKQQLCTRKTLFINLHRLFLKQEVLEINTSNTVWKFVPTNWTTWWWTRFASWIFFIQHVKNVKSFPSHKVHRAALISVSLAISQTPVYTARPRIRS